MHGGKSTGPRTESGLERCGMAHLKTGRHSKAQKTRHRMVLDIMRCVIIAGEILRAKTNEDWAADPVQRPVCCGDSGKAIKKADHLLHRLWSSDTFLSFARKHARAMYRDYLSYCRLVNHSFPSRTRPFGQPLVEGRDRLPILVDLLLGYADIVSGSMMVGLK